MAQHFLLLAAARTLSLKPIYVEGEESAYRRFCRLCWPKTRGTPICSRWAGQEHYDLAARRRFKCMACHHQFSVTSGTIFASRKLAFVDRLGVEGHVRPANARTDRVDRLKAHRTDDRRSVNAVRQREGRTLTDIVRNEAKGVRFARLKVAGGSKIVADETSHWDRLAATFDIERVNHSDAYSFFDGIHVNGAESYFARLRRMIRGQHHRVVVGRLGGYAAHAAWLEDHRRHSNGELVAQAIRNGFSALISRLWKGYWQRAA